MGLSVLPFALAIFTGAFLLFIGQPLVGKYILPWYGGGPGVWTTCLLFFQGVLLAGYAYAHLLTTWLSPRRQVLVHVVGLAAALAFLPISPGESWRPRPGDDPVASILLLLTATIGLPFVVLSATGPLLQRWFSLVHPGLSPYRLYALSNVGSLLALLAYPTVVEPRLTRAAQAGAWSIGLACFATACAACAARVWTGAGRAELENGAVDAGLEDEQAGDGVLWVALPAIASVLLVSTTTRLCQDVAAMPLLWVLPLGIYLVTFIVAFDHAVWYRRGPFTALAALGVVVTWQILAEGNSAPLKLQLAGHLATLLVTCMVCHGSGPPPVTSPATSSPSPPEGRSAAWRWPSSPRACSTTTTNFRPDCGCSWWRSGPCRFDTTAGRSRWPRGWERSSAWQRCRGSGACATTAAR